MAWWIILLIGIGIGWLIELIIDFFFWRNRKICTESVTAVRDTQTENARLTTELAVLREQLTNRSEGIRPDIVQLLTRSDDFASLRSELAALQGQMSSLRFNRENNGEQSVALSSLAQQMSARNQDIDALRSEIAALSTRFASSQSGVAGENSGINLIAAQLADRNERLSNELASLQSDLTAVRTHLQSLTASPSSGNPAEMTAALAALAAAVSAAGKGNIDIQIGNTHAYPDLSNENSDPTDQPPPSGKDDPVGEKPERPTGDDPESPPVDPAVDPKDSANLVDMVINISEEKADPYTAANGYDDFTKIPKIGKSYRTIFHDAGIKTYQDLCTLLQNKEVKAVDGGEPVHLKLDIWETVKQHDALRQFFYDSAVASQKLRDAWQAVVCALAAGNKRQISLREQEFKSIVESRAQFDNICGLDNAIEKDLYAAKIYTFYDLEKAADDQLIPILTKNSRRKTTLTKRFGTSGSEENDVQKWMKRIRYQAQLLREGKSEARKIDNLANCHEMRLIRQICGIDAEIEQALEKSGIDSPKAFVDKIQSDRAGVTKTLALFQDRLIRAYGEALMPIKVDDKAQRLAKVIDHINEQARFLSQQKWIDFLDYEEDCCGALSLETFKRSSWRRQDLTEEAKQSYEKAFAAYRALEPEYENWVKWLQDNQFINVASQESAQANGEGQ